jgi:hypothetical protein
MRWRLGVARCFFISDARDRAGAADVRTLHAFRPDAVVVERSRAVAVGRHGSEKQGNFLGSCDELDRRRTDGRDEVGTPSRAEDQREVLFLGTPRSGYDGPHADRVGWGRQLPSLRHGVEDTASARHLLDNVVGFEEVQFVRGAGCPRDDCGAPHSLHRRERVLERRREVGDGEVDRVHRSEPEVDGQPDEERRRRFAIFRVPARRDSSGEPPVLLGHEVDGELGGLHGFAPLVRELRTQCEA